MGREAKPYKSETSSSPVDILIAAGADVLGVEPFSELPAFGDAVASGAGILRGGLIPGGFLEFVVGPGFEFRFADLIVNIGLVRARFEFEFVGWRVGIGPKDLEFGADNDDEAEADFAYDSRVTFAG